MEQEIKYLRRTKPGARDLEDLFRAAWGSAKNGYYRVFDHSYTWVTALSEGQLIGFVNVAWDGDTHFFLLDTTVHPNWQRKGIGRRLVSEAIEACRGHGEWLHVDANQELMNNFYLKCGFEVTQAGLVNLRRRA
jgi:ribosomal protein S18 acetylase RimI-like enzyme